MDVSKKSAHETGAPAPASATLLLVEDENSVRELLIRLLEMQNYRVLPASDGLFARDLLARSGCSIDLLITDMVMPRMGGRELAAAARQNFPRLPILFMSGYTLEMARIQEDFAARSLFLQKPFTPTQLIKAVQVLLNLDAHS